MPYFTYCKISRSWAIKFTYLKTFRRWKSRAFHRSWHDGKRVFVSGYNSSVWTEEDTGTRGQTKNNGCLSASGNSSRKSERVDTKQRRRKNKIVCKEREKMSLKAVTFQNSQELSRTSNSFTSLGRWEAFNYQRQSLEPLWRGLNTAINLQKHQSVRPSRSYARQDLLQLLQAFQKLG